VFLFEIRDIRIYTMKSSAGEKFDFDKLHILHSPFSSGFAYNKDLLYTDTESQPIHHVDSILSVFESIGTQFHVRVHIYGYMCVCPSSRLTNQTNLEGSRWYRSVHSQKSPVEP
jgi:hypothetical protein